jgi:hypothetical protein
MKLIPGLLKSLKIRALARRAGNRFLASLKGLQIRACLSCRALQKYGCDDDQGVPELPLKNIFFKVYYRHGLRTAHKGIAIFVAEAIKHERTYRKSIYTTFEPSHM